ncbi:chitinase, partial [Streptomyces sp. SID2955]|nr:chitinase [Streptomyces sp. SID2955]
MSKRCLSALLTAVVIGTAAPVLMPAAEASAASCSSYPSWTAGKSYVTGDIVRYTDGKAYIAEHDNPGYDPVISTWYWEPYACDGGSTDPSGSFVVSEAQFNQMFPNRNSFYTYSGLKAALSAYPAFAKTGSDTVRKQEAAAFLAN